MMSIVKYRQFLSLAMTCVEDDHFFSLIVDNKILNTVSREFIQK